jgi:esterase/lipase superfamily enzyme
MRAILAGGLACLAGACASADRTAALQPASSVAIFVATTREPAEAAGEFFTVQHRPALTFAQHVVATPPNRPLGDVIMTDREADARPEQHFRMATTRAPLSEKDMVAYIGAARRKRLASILFVHGYNNTYRAGVYRVAQIATDLKMLEAPLLFSFASGGQLFDYWTDRANAEKAAPALARLIEKASVQSGGRIDVGAHSMGAWMTMLALKDIAERRGDRPGRPLLRGLMLAAPDIDAQEFEANWPRIRKLAASAVVVCHEDDLALKLSMTIAGMGRRVGNLEDCANEAPKRFPGIMVIDSRATETQTRDVLKHNPATNPRLIAQFAEELRSRRMMVTGVDREIDTTRDQ